MKDKFSSNMNGYFGPNWVSILASFVSILALIVSVGGLIVNYYQLKTIKDQNIINVSLRCKAIRKPLNFVRQENQPTNFVSVIQIPTTCVLTNKSNISIGIEKISPVSFKNENEISLKRGIDKVDLDRSNLSLYTNSLEFPKIIEARSSIEFESQTIIPVFLYNRTMSGDIIYGNFDVDAKNKYDKIESCFSINNDLKNQLICFEKIINKTFVNYVYEGTTYPGFEYGKVTGGGIKVTLYNGEEIADEVDLTRNFGGYTENKTINVLRYPYYFHR